MLNERAEGRPAEAAPDICEFVTCLPEQVTLYRLAVLYYELREAEDSPIGTVEASFDAFTHALVIAL